MKVIFLFGPMAAGKMTVGQQLHELTAIPLLYNHLTIEVSYSAFGFIDWDLVHGLRCALYRRCQATGAIITMCVDWDDSADVRYMYGVMEEFPNAQFYGVCLTAPAEERARRLSTSNRLKYKPSQADTAEAHERMLQNDKFGRFVARHHEVPFPIITLDTSKHTPQKAVILINQFIEGD